MIVLQILGWAFLGLCALVVTAAAHQTGQALLQLADTARKREEREANDTTRIWRDLHDAGKPKAAGK